ncbi:MAG: Uma2 family endonuclease [Deltaproteobacteria bacterium]|nr:Uma2 family endonuclease [Deltaproteobacteria bacterium]
MHALDLPFDPEYPDSDGKPMSDNTKQYEWIVTIKGNLDVRLPDFVGGDLLWYPVKGEPKVRQAPDVLVALGRPKGHRGSYKQWEEAGVAPQVAFEILSPGNTASEWIRKLSFYSRHGVEELYAYDPDTNELTIWLRDGDELRKVESPNGFVSPRLGIRFQLLAETLEILDPEGKRFETFAELAARGARADERAAAERQRADGERQRADAERQRAEIERQRADAERQRADALAAKLKALGLEASSTGSGQA